MNDENVWSREDVIVTITRLLNDMDNHELVAINNQLSDELIKYIGDDMFEEEES